MADDEEAGEEVPTGPERTAPGAPSDEAPDVDTPAWEGPEPEDEGPKLVDPRPEIPGPSIL